MEAKLLRKLVEGITAKKEIKGINNQIVISTIERLKRKYPGIEFASQKEIKQFIKEARAELRRMSGSFHPDYEIKSHLSDINNILSSHSSTKERMENYQMLKDTMKELKVSSILDIGCGINPIALASLDYTYNACDINSADLELVRDFFRKEGIKGKVFAYDIRNIRREDIPESDLCIMWKLLDIIESSGHKKAEEIIRKLSCRYIWISFPTRTLSGKPMNHPQRGWIERLLERLGFSYSIKKTHNEIFYLASKKFSLQQA